jgi:hypothetical protein
LDHVRETLNIGNICAGAVPSVFAKALEELQANIADPNTESESKRKLTIEFVFSPFKDRSGAIVDFQVKTKLVPVERKTGNVFFSNASGTRRAYARDPKQDELFAREAPATPQAQ